ncbi:MAG: hypothetical protein RBT11_17910 [Desulfobacterales bacterium]|jgi:P27 family predicted phage terminase small subunit|nr:hypothetical protein [Desulfobacterales bacterium]
MGQESPKNLSTEASRLWEAIVSEYEIDDSIGLAILCRALESFDRMREAQRAIQEHGVVFVDRFNQIRNNPANAVERDSRAAFLASLKQLNVDVEIAPSKPGRPPG